MSQTLTLSLGDAQKQNATAVAEHVRDLPEVQDARLLETRTIDAESVIMLIKMSGELIAAASALWTFVTHIRNSLNEQKISGAKLTLPNGVRLEVDTITEEQLKQLIKAGRK